MTIRHYYQEMLARSPFLGAAEKCVLYLNFWKTGYRPFAEDLSLHGNTGSSVGVTGHDMLGTYFDGVDDNNSIASAVSLNSITNFTIACWVSPRVMNQAYSYILGREDTDLDVAYAPTGLVSFYDGSWKSTSATMTMGQWNCLVLTWDGTNVVTYLNGALQSTVVGGRWTDSKGLKVGSNYAGTIFSNCSIGEKRLWSKALTAKEVWDYYQNTRHIPGV